MGVDASKWAKEFMRLQKKVGFTIDEELMKAWFANAIMAGMDEQYNKCRTQIRKEICGEILQNLPGETYSWPWNDCLRACRSAVLQVKDKERMLQEVIQDPQESGPTIGGKSIELNKAETPLAGVDGDIIEREKILARIDEIDRNAVYSLAARKDRVAELKQQLESIK